MVVALAVLAVLGGIVYVISAVMQLRAEDRARCEQEEDDGET